MDGGGSTGGTVVGGPSPIAAMDAGAIGQNAAYLANQLATQQSQNALTSLQQSYADQLSSLQPATSEGITAMDSLNQLLGLPAYQPTTAPTAPTAPTAANSISQAQIDQYIAANTNAQAQYNNNSYNIDQYYGVGAHASQLANGTYNLNDPGNAIGWNDAEKQAYTAQGNGVGWYGMGAQGLQQVENDPTVTAAVQNYLFNQEQPQLQNQYNAQQQVYNQQMGLYNQAQTLAQNYQQLTPDQISAKLAATPGYQFNLSQGENAIQNAASKSGNAFSGNMLSGLVQYANGLAQQTYGQQVQNLANLVNAGNQASSQASNAAGNLGTNTANVYNNLGSTQANSTLSGANSEIQGLLAANQQYQILGQSSTGSNLGGLGSIVGGLLGSGGVSSIL